MDQTLSPLPPFFKDKRNLILLGLFLISGILIFFSIYFVPNYLLKNGSRQQLIAEDTFILPVNPQPKAIIAKFKVLPDGSGIFLESKETYLDLPPGLTTPPQSSVSTYVFNTNIISKNGSISYKSWKSYPIIKEEDGSFIIGVLIPYQAESILKVTNLDNKVVISVSL